MGYPGLGFCQKGATKGKEKGNYNISERFLMWWALAFKVSYEDREERRELWAGKWGKEWKSWKDLNIGIMRVTEQESWEGRTFGSESCSPELVVIGCSTCGARYDYGSMLLR